MLLAINVGNTEMKLGVFGDRELAFSRRLATHPTRTADLLPQVEIGAPRSVIAKNTVESIQAGLVFGTAAEVDGVIERIQKDIGPATGIATGGRAAVVLPYCTSIDHHDQWLTLQGLRI